MTSLSAEVSVHGRIAQIGRASWDACATPAGQPANPFVAFDFLDILEEAGCVSARTGWAPQHLAAHDANGRVAAVMPLYLKSHSQGEYIFDYAWADAYERAGGRYYPKLVSASPFSPVTGPRLLVRPDVDQDQADTLRQVAGALGGEEAALVSTILVGGTDQLDDATQLGTAKILVDAQFKAISVPRNTDHGLGIVILR